MARIGAHLVTQPSPAERGSARLVSVTQDLVRQAPLSDPGCYLPSRMVRLGWCLSLLIGAFWWRCTCEHPLRNHADHSRAGQVLTVVRGTWHVALLNPLAGVFSYFG